MLSDGRARIDEAQEKWAKNMSVSGGSIRSWHRHLRCGWFVIALVAQSAQASVFKGEALDQIAEVVSWIALVVGPIAVIVVFWMVHILPEKIAERRKHPQTKAIQTLCLLSLFFGGILWPLAWLWAYSKPVLHRLAYGTDEAEHGDELHRDPDATATEPASEMQRLRVKRTPEREMGAAPVEPHVSNRERA
jgi:CBS domain containing-hemolysin-like protein